MVQPAEPVPVHFLLRVPPVTRIEGHAALAVNTIDAHSQVIQELGHATVAKFGRPATAYTVERLQRQIKKGIRTRLILVVKTNDTRRKTYVGYQSEIGSVRLGSPTEELRKAAPTYYRLLAYGAGLWFTVCASFKICDLTKARIASNKKPVLEVLRTSRTPSMLVEIASD
jgi:hypothetical protein